MEVKKWYFCDFKEKIGPPSVLSTSQKFVEKDTTRVQEKRDGFNKHFYTRIIKTMEQHVLVTNAGKQLS